MTLERTLSIIKPDAVERNLTGAINSKLEAGGLKIKTQRMARLSKRQAEEFYKEHQARPFFQSLVESMISGPVVLQVLEGEDAVKKNRDIMGATNPADAAPGTIRKEFAIDIEKNSVHGSDSTDSAKREVSFFFSESEMIY